MDERKVTHLIEEVHRFPAIWNKTVPEHSNKHFVGSEWSKVAANINVAKTQAQTKWKSLVKKFKSEHTLVQFHRSGDGLENVYESKWPYYISLLFIANTAVANPSSGNFDRLFDVKPSETSVSSNESVIPVTPIFQSSLKNSTLSVNQVSSSMSHKKNDIAEQILRMENEKKALLEQSSTYNMQANSVQEQDKLHMAFFETLIPTLREIRKEDILLCRGDISRIIYHYAYKGSEWKSLSDSINQGPTRSKSRRTYEDDDCQIVSDTRPTCLQSNIPIKVEQKYRPTAREREIEHRSYNNSEMAMQQLGNDRRAYFSRLPSQWNNQYDQQVLPQYPGQYNIQHIGYQDCHNECAIPRRTLGNITSSSSAVSPYTADRTYQPYPSTVIQPTAASQTSIAANINVIRSDRFFSDRQGEFESNKENESVTQQIRRTHTSTEVRPGTADSVLYHSRNLSKRNHSETFVCEPQLQFQNNNEKD